MDSKPYSIAPQRSLSEGGFTLVELMITVLIAGLIMAAVMAAYISQQRTYLAQEQVAEMQQNIRAALHIMTKEIRMAGYDRDGSAGAGITTASPSQMGFTQDIDSDGELDGPDETIIFGFANTDDADGDGIADIGAAPLGRDPGTGFQAIAENIEAIQILYLDRNNNPLNRFDTAVPPATVSDIRAVQISILARAAQPDQNHFNNNTYTTPPDSDGNVVNWGPGANPAPNNFDNFRRRFVTTTIQCRNLGLL